MVETALVVVLWTIATLAYADVRNTSLVGTGSTAGGGSFQFLLSNILIFTNNVLIPFILGIGFLVFVYGMFYYFIAGGANDEKKEQGKSLAIYAILGFVLIIIFWGIINLIAVSTGLIRNQAENKNYGFTTPGGIVPRGPAWEGTCLDVDYYGPC